MSTSDRINSILQNSPGGLYKDLWENKISQDAGNLFQPSNEGWNSAMEKVRSEDYVFINMVSFIELMISQQQYCDITISDDRFSSMPYAFAAYKGFPYKTVFNRK